MKRTREALIWAAFLVLAGVFLLLRNLGIFAQWGDLAWGALFALAGLGFLGWFLRSVDRWWRAIPAFMLLGIGAGVILQWRNIELGTWNIPLVLFGMALGFWAVLFVRREHWWALIPAGVLTVLAVELGLWNRLDPVWRMAVLYLGIGLVFLLLYAIRYEEADTRWAAIPAAAMLLFGLVTVMQSLPLPLLLKQWWPTLLAVAGWAWASARSSSAGPRIPCRPPSCRPSRRCRRARRVCHERPPACAGGAVAARADVPRDAGAGRAGTIAGAPA